MSISFRFIHMNDAKASEDDMCHVTKSGENSFVLDYSYRNNVNVKCTNTLTVNSDSVLQWTRRVIDMLERDAEPLARMQIDFPMLPSIIFNVNELGQHYNAILDAVEFSVDNWATRKVPQVTRAPVAAPLRRQNWDAMSASTDSSMPSLIPMNRTGVTTRSQVRQHLFLDETA